jgi:hypothetical protein
MGHLVRFITWAHFAFTTAVSSLWMTGSEINFLALSAMNVTETGWLVVLLYVVGTSHCEDKRQTLCMLLSAITRSQ